MAELEIPLDMTTASVLCLGYPEIIPEAASPSTGSLISLAERLPDCSENRGINRQQIISRGLSRRFKNCLEKSLFKIGLIKLHMIGSAVIASTPVITLAENYAQFDS